MTHGQYIQQAKCEKKSMQQAKCYPCNKPNGMIHEEYIQQVKCQKEHIQQSKCYPCN